jgi:hypothetical protein
MSGGHHGCSSSSSAFSPIIGTAEVGRPAWRSAGRRQPVDWSSGRWRIGGDGRREEMPLRREGSGTRVRGQAAEEHRCLRRKGGGARVVVGRRDHRCLRREGSDTMWVSSLAILRTDSRGGHRCLRNRGIRGGGGVGSRSCKIYLESWSLGWTSSQCRGQQCRYRTHQRRCCPCGRPRVHTPPRRGGCRGRRQ